MIGTDNSKKKYASFCLSFLMPEGFTHTIRTVCCLLVLTPKNSHWIELMHLVLMGNYYDGLFILICHYSIMSCKKNTSLKTVGCCENPKYLRWRKYRNGKTGIYLCMWQRRWEHERKRSNVPVGVGECGNNRNSAQREKCTWRKNKTFSQKTDGKPTLAVEIGRNEMLEARDLSSYISATKLRLWSFRGEVSILIF